MQAEAHETRAPQRMKPVTGKLFRSVCGQFMTGVTIVTTMAEGTPIGLTINSFTSVSIDPPMVLFCLDRRSGVSAVLRRTRYFAVNILADDQEHLGRIFTNGIGPRFDGTRVWYGTTGAPVLAESLAYLDCRVFNEFDGGDHTIFLGQVVDLGIQRQDRGPLTFFRGTMGIAR